MDPRLIVPADMLRLNTRLYRNCLQDLSDELARERPSGKGPTNCAAFIAAHLVESRYYVLSILGRNVPSPLKAPEGGFNDITKVTTYPTLAELRSAWDAAAEALEREFKAVPGAKLDEKFDQFPVDLPTVLGALSFMMEHESYHLGQLGFLRKHAGLEAMAYS